MHARGVRIALTLTALLFVPGAAAEFGPETEDGWPINVDGEPIYPPVDGMLTTQVPEPLNKVGPVTAYPYYPLLVGELQRLVLDHPDKVKLQSAGTSRAGLDLWYLEIADFDRIGAGEGLPLDQREVVYLDGGTHSNEYSGVYFVTELAQFLLDEYESNETAQWIVENRHTFILPMVNPDGSNVFGRLNAIGVNVNRNFPHTWGTVDENPVLNNPGPEPGSEPESQAVMALVDQIQPDYVNSIHCCGNLWLHPYGAEQLGDPVDMEMFTRICDEVFYDVREDCGPIWSTIYPASGTTADEGYGRVGASSWTYEMSGRGAVAPWGQPVITDDVREQERESWRGVLHALQHVHKYGAWPVIDQVVGTEERLTVRLTNDGWGPMPAGNLSIDDTRIALPPLAVNETATVALVGDFSAGTASLGLDWTDRMFLAPQDARSYDLVLESVGDGRLVGSIAGLSLAPLPNGGDLEDTPFPAVAWVLLGIVALVLAARRR